MEEKVYLKIETPFSMKNPKTRAMALYMAFIVLAMAAVVALLWNNPENRDLAKRLGVFFLLWFGLGGVPCAVMIFNSYAKVVDGELICNKFGFFETRYPRGSVDRAVATPRQIQLFSQGKVILTLPNSGPARNLVSRLRLRLIQGR